VKKWLCGTGMSCGAVWTGQLAIVAIVICVTVLMLAMMVTLAPDLREWSLRMRWPPHDDEGGSDREPHDDRDDGG
jgi:hypothetical protein